MPPFRHTRRRRESWDDTTTISERERENELSYKYITLARKEEPRETFTGEEEKRQRDEMSRCTDTLFMDPYSSPLSILSLIWILLSLLFKNWKETHLPIFSHLILPIIHFLFFLRLSDSREEEEVKNSQTVKKMEEAGEMEKNLRRMSETMDDGRRGSKKMHERKREKLKNQEA